MIVPLSPGQTAHDSEQQFTEVEVASAGYLPRARDFYRVIVDVGAARVNYLAIEIESE